ncbi:hypothetical protein [Clostridium sp. C8-1-8]|uniref:hypothetical protein n=1 Tax=Clostridium sp. C8-1-8 TaxID=2698831 RepID=UPI0013713572|nr:hypothetical protein [Clostridium sp. C8-1-8]
MRKKALISIVLCIFFVFSYIVWNFHGYKANGNSKSLSMNYVNKAIHQNNLSIIEYTDKFSLEDTLINNILMASCSTGNVDSIRKSLDTVNSEIRDELSNTSLSNSNPELLLSNVYFYVMYLNKINVKAPEEIKRSISDFINYSYVKPLDSLKQKDKLVLLDSMEKISFLQGVLSLDANIKNFILNSVNNIKLNSNNVNFENETILLYKINIFKMLSLYKEVNEIQPLVNTATNNIAKNIDDTFVNDIENIPLLSMLFDNMAENEKLSKFKNKVFDIVKSNVDLPAVLKFYCFKIISDNKELQSIIDTYPRDSKCNFTAPAQLVPTFKTLYFLLSLDSISDNQLNINKSPTKEYISDLLSKYKDTNMDISEIYYFLQVRKYVSKDKKFDLINNLVNKNISEIPLKASNEKDNFVTLYWKIKVMLSLNRYDNISKLESDFSKSYESIKDIYKNDSNKLIVDLMYYEILNATNKNTNGIDLNSIGKELLNYSNDSYVHCIYIYFNIVNSCKVKIKDQLINDLEKKLNDYKTIYGYSANVQYKSTNLQATFEGVKALSLIDSLKNNN